MATLSSLLPASVVTNLAAGDSDVAVTDSGTGKIEFTVDNVEVADFTTGEVVFNETGANQDFRVESDTNANMLVVDAGVNKVGIGTNTFNTNGGVLQVSNGISFPATQSASSDANTLDDYEEGTWTPTVVGSTNMTSATGVDGKYVKIGKQVYCEADFTGSITSSSAETNINFALPFTRSGNQTVGAVSLLIGSGADSFGVGVVTHGGIIPSRQQIFIAANQVNSTGSVSWLRFSLTYTV